MVLGLCLCRVGRLCNTLGVYICAEGWSFLDVGFFSFWVLLKLGKMIDVWAVRLRVYAVYRSFSVGG